MLTQDKSGYAKISIKVNNNSIRYNRMKSIDRVMVYFIIIYFLLLVAIAGILSWYTFQAVFSNILATHIN